MILQIPNRNLTIINRVYLRETLPGFSVTRNNSNALLILYGLSTLDKPMSFGVQRYKVFLYGQNIFYFTSQESTSILREMAAGRP